MRRPAAILLIVLTLASLASGLPAQVADGAPSYRSWLETAVLAGRDLIAVGKLEKFSELPNGERIARIALDRVIRGEETQHVLVVGASEAYRQNSDRRRLLFLDRPGGRSFHSIVDFVDLEGEEGGRRLEAVRTLLAVGDLVLERERVAALRRFVLDAVGNDSAWVRRVAAREFDGLRRHAPSTFQTTDVGRLRAMPIADLPETERRMFRRGLIALEQTLAIDWVRRGLDFPDEEKRASFLRDLAAYESGTDVAARLRFLDLAAGRFGGAVGPLLARGLTDRQPEIRGRCVHLLGELESGSGVAGLLELLGRSEDRELHPSAVEALEKIAPLEAVPTLLRLVERSDTRHAALRALAAVNSGEARLFLEDLRKSLDADPEAAEEDRARLVHLLSASFRRELAQAREERRQRWPVARGGN
ncbi:MAG: HEAT repeat domain-containing protein [Planctomycetota bacterium]